MKYIFYICCFLTLFFSGCGKDVGAVPEPKDQTEIRLFASRHNMGPSWGRAIDEDNLPSEQTIRNISVFFTDPDSELITEKYVYAGFSSVDDYKVITLPSNLSGLGTKDIYVVTNYDDPGLSSVSNLTDLKNRTTPKVDKNNNLDPEKGICMFGRTSGFDFANATGSAIVMVVRTCAKYRINLSFPYDGPQLSTDNTFVMTHAANYTYLGEKSGNSIPSDAYFNFLNKTPLISNGGEVYSNVAYVYEATQAPVLYIYTRIHNIGTQSFQLSLPVPKRNYLYDIDVLIYGSTGKTSADSPYNIKTTVRVYDEQGMRRD